MMTHDGGMPKLSGDIPQFFISWMVSLVYDGTFENKMDENNTAI